MLQILAIKKSFKKLALNKKGFSSIVGAIFAVLVILSMTTAVFVWSVNQNTNYNNAVRQTTQADLDRLNEKALANVTATRINNTAVTVNGILENIGSLPVTINTLWVSDATFNQFNSTSPLNIILNAGSMKTLSGSTALNISLTNNPTDKLVCWFVSSRGNIISQYSLVLASLGTTNVTNNYLIGNFTNNGNVSNVYNVGGTSTTYANVSQGIGLIAFDFKGFSHQDFSSQTSAPLNNLQKSYVIYSGKYTVFHVSLTNFDPSQAIMSLNVSSAIYVIVTQGAAVKYGWWTAVNVTGTSQSGYTVNPSNTNVNYMLNYSVPTDVFFAGSPGFSGGFVSGVYPLNIMVFGKLGTNDYGQNVPFVAVNIPS